MRTRRLAAVISGTLAVCPAVSADDVQHLGTLYLHTNQHGDAVVATNNAGDVLAIADNRPWGDRGPRTRGMSQVRRTFDAWEHDDATGLLYAGARYYDPRLGRFLSVDPAGQAVYVALGSAPLQFVDPDGRAWYPFYVNGRPAFTRLENGLYKQILGSAPVRAGEPRLPTHVYIADDLVRNWDNSIFTGWTRWHLRNVELREANINQYLEGLPIGKEEADALRRTINSWALQQTKGMLEDADAVARVEKMPVQAESPGSTSVAQGDRPLAVEKTSWLVPMNRRRSRSVPLNAAATASVFERVSVPSRRSATLPEQRRERRQLLLTRTLPDMPTTDPLLGENWLWPPR